MRSCLGILAIIATTIVAVPATAQVTFRSSQVRGITTAERAVGGALSPSDHDDEGVRLHSRDGRNYEVEAYGCRYELAPLRESLTPEDERVVSTVLDDIGGYRAEANKSLGTNGQLVPIAVGELLVVSAAETGPERYGLGCTPSKVTVAALDVARAGTMRELRILILQTEEGAAAQKSTTVTLAFMRTLIFKPTAEAELNRASALTEDLYHALTR